MALIDFDKFLASFITEMKECSQMKAFSIPRCIKKALDDQGLEYKDGEIVKSQRRVSAESNENGYGESEDERIRKEIKVILANTDFSQFALDYTFADMLAWLEKQGEQNPIDKVGPKFHEGDWLCENELNNYSRFIQILEIINIQGKERYRISRDIRNNEDIVEFGFLEKYYHKFDIKDAKEGDVLVASDESLFIFARAKDNAAYYHFSLCKNGSQEISDGKHAWEVAKDCHPATKEQRDLLFQKMSEAGYVWDAEKKKIEPKNDKCIKSDDNAPTAYGKYVDECLFEASKHFHSTGEDAYSVADLFYAGVRCGINWTEKKGQKSEWSSQ